MTFPFWTLEIITISQKQRAYFPWKLLGIFMVHSEIINFRILVTPWHFIKGHHQDEIIWIRSEWADLNLVHLHAEVVGAAGHVGQRADKVMAALKWWIQQHSTHLLHFLQPQNTQRVFFNSEHISINICLQQGSLHFFIWYLTSRTWASTAAQGEEKPESTMGHRASCGSVSTQLFPNISISWVSTPGKDRNKDFFFFKGLVLLKWSEEITIKLRILFITADYCEHLLVKT